jgi:hypothetical protein
VGLLLAKLQKYPPPSLGDDETVGGCEEIAKATQFRLIYPLLRDHPRRGDIDVSELDLGRGCSPQEGGHRPGPGPGRAHAESVPVCRCPRGCSSASRQGPSRSRTSRSNATAAIRVRVDDRAMARTGARGRPAQKAGAPSGNSKAASPAPLPSSAGTPSGRRSSSRPGTSRSTVYSGALMGVLVWNSVESPTFNDDLAIH